MELHPDLGGVFWVRLGWIVTGRFAFKHDVLMGLHV
jgi:hypothetical protein